MKPIEDIESTRRDYHRDVQKDTVHRSSLLAPELSTRLPGSRVDLSFSNHFLLKRGYDDVACRITAVGPDGRAVISRTHPVSEPRVYAFELSDLTDEPVDNYLIEFFASHNLFIPFPAAMVNHRGPSFLNSVHSYNRVLNDVFEDDAVNAERVKEASIDIRVDDETDTFVLFTAGPAPCRGTLEVAVHRPGRSLSREVPVDLPRLGNQWISLAELFGDEIYGTGGVLTVRQPAQSMFYGRLLAGLHARRDAAIAANHSFYDCSNRAEYCDDGRASARVYPLLEGLDARVRLYPIFSPCDLHAAVEFYDVRGGLLGSFESEPLRSPSPDVLDISVREARAAAGAEGAVAFRFRAWPSSGGTPRRINHQVVYEDPEGRSPLAASVAISLRNPNHFQPSRKEGLIWGQCAVHEDLATRVGVALDEPGGGAPERILLSLLSEKGEVHREELELHPGAAHAFDPARLAPGLVPSGDARPHYLWYWARCSRSDLSGYSVTRHRRTAHCSGEHCF